MAKVFGFDKLGDAELIVDAIYEGGTSGNASDDPLARLVPCGNQGGFRIRGRRTSHDYRIALLYTSLADPDWPDSLDRETGLFTYFGDNKGPGHELHETPRGGNELLRFCFAAIHSNPPQRRAVPPFFVFGKAIPGRGRDVRFLGVAVPGAKDVGGVDDLVAVWRTKSAERFQNYEAVFTILNEGSIPRAWIEDLAAGDPLSPNCPGAMRVWWVQGTYTPLMAPRTLEYRRPAEQVPETEQDAALVAAIHAYFEGNATDFEACALELWRMLSPTPISQDTLTRPSGDGGRDAYGLYEIGPKADPIKLDFSLEAKCKMPTSGSGVDDVARLISRLRHRQFGVFVTTSYVHDQAYREVREDQHPIVFITGRDIAEVLKANDKSTVAAVTSWLEQQFPKP